MKRLSAWPFLAAILISTFALAQTPAQNHDSDPEWPLPQLDRFDVAVVDKQIDPCSNFYDFVCSKWSKSHSIPADEVYWSTSSNLELYNETIDRNALQEAAMAKDRDPVHQKIGDYWASCMNEGAADRDGIKPIQPALDRIAAMKNKSDLASVIASMHKSVPGAWGGDDNQTSAPLFGFGQTVDFKDATVVVGEFDQGGLSLPSRDYYLSDDAKMTAIRAKFVEHVQKQLQNAGEPADQAKTDAATVLRIETVFAKAQMDNVKRRDPANINHPMQLAQFGALTPSFDWSSYLKLLDAPTPKHYIVTTPEFFQTLETELKAESLDNWKAYLRWWTIRGAARYLSKPIVDERFDFYGKTLFGQEQMQPRWRRCVAYVDRDLGEALGQAYVDKAFPPASKQRVKDLVNAIETSLGQDIQTLEWMSPATKEQALVKLKAIYDKIGYPDRWRDYSSVKIVPDNMVENVRQASAFESRRQMMKIGKPVDREEFTMTPPTINAYYDPQMNTINFPAGILQAPFFDPTKPEEMNYGAIGLVIGHEISHGFDDQGRKFDAKGNLRDWWTESDAKGYDQRAACISKEYTHDIPELGVKTNGELTLGEDSADNAGLRMALLALENTYKKQGKSLDEKDSDGWTPRQKFYMANAFSWCENDRPEFDRAIITTNPHSLNQYRINYVDKNSADFAKTFGCHKGQAMVSDDPCRVW